MLASDIDAVVVSTPMQLHVPQSIAALHAGKHVLSEVTAGVTMDELWWLKENVPEPIEFKDGYVYVPDRPGLGVTVDERLVEKFRVG